MISSFWERQVRLQSASVDQHLIDIKGYTGELTAKHIAVNLPMNLKWAVAGRSEAKLKQLVSECQTLKPDRTLPGSYFIQV